MPTQQRRTSQCPSSPTSLPKAPRLPAVQRPPSREQPSRRVPSPRRWLPGSKEGPAHLSSPLFSPPHSSEHAPPRGWISPHHVTSGKAMDTQTLTVLSVLHKWARLSRANFLSALVMLIGGMNLNLRVRGALPFPSPGEIRRPRIRAGGARHGQSHACARGRGGAPGGVAPVARTCQEPRAGPAAGGPAPTCLLGVLCLRFHSFLFLMRN